MFLLLLLCIPIAVACTEARDNMVITHNTTLCGEADLLPSGISIQGDNIHVACTGTILSGLRQGKGISIEHGQNITVIGCRVHGYETGIYVRNSSRVYLMDNFLLRNGEGVRMVATTQSATYNQDVSLEPFAIFGSERNILSASNRRIEGGFCSDNVCNGNRKLIDFWQVQTGPGAFHAWLRTQLLKKTPQRLLQVLKIGLNTEESVLQ